MAPPPPPANNQALLIGAPGAPPDRNRRHGVLFGEPYRAQKRTRLVSDFCIFYALGLDYPQAFVAQALQSGTDPGYRLR